MRVRVPLLPALFRWGAVAAVAAFVLYFSVLAVPPESPLDTVRFSIVPLDKWRHFLAYAGLGGALAYAIADWDLEARTALALVITLVVAYGVGIELLQGLRPNRHLSAADAYANALGAVLVAPWFWLRRSLAFVPLREWLGDVSSKG